MFVGILSLMFIVFINYHVVDTIEFLNLFYMPMQNANEVLRGPHNLRYAAALKLETDTTILNLVTETDMSQEISMHERYSAD
jgi:hypothetical protein